MHISKVSSSRRRLSHHVDVVVECMIMLEDDTDIPAL